MDMLEMLINRRSIRKYLKKRVEREKLEKIVEAGLYAPNPGGRQSARVIMLDAPELIEKIGVVNAACENRNWGGRSVSADQPSIIDDPAIASGFYGCVALAIVCVPRASVGAVNGVGAAFVCAQNMVIAASSLGVSSCIVGRAQATFDDPEVGRLPEKWGLDPEYTPLVFVCLGYIDGEYPKPKPRLEGRSIFVHDI